MTPTVDRAELQALMDEGAVTVVDALPAAPFAGRHLPGAVNLTIEEADERATAVLPDPGAGVVVYSTDANCDRAPALAERLERLGYGDVRLYDAGIADWVAAGPPVETGG